jgi:voltage-gated potassium channel
VRALRARRLACIFGDGGLPAVLEAAGGGHAALVVVALPDAATAAGAVRTARALNAGAPIVARARRPGEADRLRHHGATDVVQPEMEAAATVIQHALAALRLPDAAALAYLTRFRQAMAAIDGTPAGEGTLPEVRELTLGGARLAAQSLRQAQIRERFGVTVVAIRRLDGSVVFNPAPDALLHEGDRVRVFGLPEQIRAFGAEAEAA